MQFSIRPSVSIKDAIDIVPGCPHSQLTPIAPSSIVSVCYIAAAAAAGGAGLSARRS